MMADEQVSKNTREQYLKYVQRKKDKKKTLLRKQQRKQKKEQA
tara:strand:+ start:237 stop:365 length:129 start_codon:yes stop_codon:yes gene_type:complete